MGAFAPGPSSKAYLLAQEKQCIKNFSHCGVSNKHKFSLKIGQLKAKKF
jgi:hypothetical protein